MSRSFTLEELNGSSGGTRSQPKQGGYSLDDLNSIAAELDEKYKQLANSPIEIGGKRYATRHEALMASEGAFSDANRRNKFVNDAYAALRKDALAELRRDKYDQFAAENRPSEQVPWWRVGSTQREYDRLTEANRPQGSAGLFENMLTSFTSIYDSAMPSAAGNRSPQVSSGKGVVDSFIGRVKEAAGVAKDLASTIAGGYADSVNLKSQDVASVARPSANSGISEIDNSLRNVDVMSPQGIIQGDGRVRRTTEVDRRDREDYLKQLQYNSDTGYTGS